MLQAASTAAASTHHSKLQAAEQRTKEKDTALRRLQKQVLLPPEALSLSLSPSPSLPPSLTHSLTHSLTLFLSLCRRHVYKSIVASVTYVQGTSFGTRNIFSGVLNILRKSRHTPAHACARNTQVTLFGSLLFQPFQGSFRRRSLLKLAAKHTHPHTHAHMPQHRHTRFTAHRNTFTNTTQTNTHTLSLSLSHTHTHTQISHTTDAKNTSKTKQDHSHCNELISVVH